MTDFKEAIEYLKPYADKEAQAKEMLSIKYDNIGERKDFEINNDVRQQELTNRVNNASYIALKAMDKLQRKEVSEGMAREIRYFDMWLLSTSDVPEIEEQNKILVGAIGAQLIKECEQEK